MPAAAAGFAWIQPYAPERLRVELEERLQEMDLSLRASDEESAPAAETPAGEEDDKGKETEDEA